MVNSAKGTTARRQKYTMSDLALASRRANLEKARAAPKEKIYRPTEKRQAASRANMAKAIAARKSPRGNASARLNALSHGLFAQDVAASVSRMGEDPREQGKHHALFERVLVAQDDEERQCIKRMADINWKRLRFFRALAGWEMERLHKAFAPLARSASISAEETLRRAYIFSRVWSGYLEYLEAIGKFQSRMEREIRKLLRKRSGGKVKFRGTNPARGTRDVWSSTMDDLLDDMLDAPRVRMLLEDSRRSKQKSHLG